jgi:hypothetical protein
MLWLYDLVSLSVMIMLVLVVYIHWLYVWFDPWLLFISLILFLLSMGSILHHFLVYFKLPRV